MSTNNPIDEEKTKSLNFIEQIIEDEKAAGATKIYTRFPPEPNGYLHIGHAKSICLNFGLAQQYGGLTNLRFDDTNPEKEDVEYVNSIKEDVQWLGFEWEGMERYTSDYFDDLYAFAEKLVSQGKAYVCFLSAEEMAVYKGKPTAPGKNSPTRDTTPEENMELFRKMRNGDYKDGDCVLRAKIDMSSPNMHLRDPNLYRIKHMEHQRTGNKWCIYPSYDFAHGQSDYFEGITHSVCTLEFEVHRPLYGWLVDNLKDTDYRPNQIEFARLNLSYTVMSKRKLLELVQLNMVDGWDDPRMPTISGLRRRGYTPESIRKFADIIGVARRNNVIDMGVLEFAVREDLNKRANRVMGVLDPLKVVVTNYPESGEEYLDAVNNPEDESAGKRPVPFSRELYIERGDFMEDAPRKFFRLAPGREVRLRYAYFVTCTDVIKDAEGNITELHVTYDPESKGGKSPDGRKVKGTIHWVSAKHAINAEVRLYDRLFNNEDPVGHKDTDFKEFINTDSLEIRQNCKLEPSLATAKPGEHYQFERLGYFTQDSKYSTAEKPVFNRTVSLRDGWAKAQKKGK